MTGQESSRRSTGERYGGDGGVSLLRLATYASVATALTLILAKAVAYFMTDSVSLLSTLLDSLLDAAASILNLFAVRHALTPADREHRFGHGKAEPLAGLGQAAFITGSAIFLLFEAGQRLISPRPLENTEIGIAVMLFSIAATVALVTFQRHVIRRTGSVAIKADSLHYVGDLLVNGSVVVALLLEAQLGWPGADALFGIGIALYIVYTAWQIARISLDMLMDRELPDEDRKRIREIALEQPLVLSLHDLRTRSAGPNVFIQLHLEMDGALSLFEAHAAADAVEVELMRAFPGAEVIIHQDPAGVDERRDRPGPRA
ncbi:MAG: iron transporter [Alphaproteobacteria bacterium]|nr:MAG: iron transporter [Alphaproteobacteria bacterium]